METKIFHHTTELLKAAIEGHTAQAQALIQDGVDLNAADERGRTPLMLAAANGHTYIVQILLDNGADPSVCDCSHMTALAAAEAKGYARIASLLKSALANRAPAMMTNAPVRSIQTNGVPRQTLHQAADKGDAALVAALIAEGADANARTEKNWTPLMLATIKGHTDVVRMLLSKGANADAKNNKGWTALMFAVSLGDVETMRVLLQNGADANATDVEGKTALAQAASENNLASVRLLLEHKVNINIADHANETALSIAARRNYAEMLELLEAAGKREASRETVGAQDALIDLGDTKISAESLFDECELQRLKDDLEDYLPQTWPPATGKALTIEPHAPTAVVTAATVPADFARFCERVVAALEALSQAQPVATLPRLSLPAAPATTNTASAVPLADLAHKIMLTLPEAAALTSLSRAHLRRAIAAKRLEAQIIGRSWRIKRVDLDAYISAL